MTEELKKEIEDCKTLDKLFGYWEQAHKDEENPYETLPKGSSDNNMNKGLIESFSKDGITSLKGNVNTEESNVDILFVLKESNCSGDKISGDKVNVRFWFNEKTEGDETRNKYAERLGSALEKVIGKPVDPKYKFGYINLNKRGGYGSTNRNQLEAYTLKYYPFIKKEIEILSPKYIIFCGCFDAFAKACRKKDNQCLHNWDRKNPQKQKYSINKNKHAYIVNIYHPSRRNSDKKFCNSLKILETLNDNK